MHTRQVPPAEWRKTLDVLSSSYDGAFVSLECTGGMIGAEEELRDQPLRGISSDRSGVTVQIAKTGGVHVGHRIAGPKRIRLVESDEGALIAVEIENRDGVQSLVRFRWPSRPELFAASVE